VKDEIEQRRDLAPKTQEIIDNKTYVDYAVYAKFKGKIKM
jgi:hydroxymethylglutaryl-CoA synthase